MARDFKIGDRVRVVKMDMDACGEQVGDTGTVVDLSSDNVAVLFDNPNVLGWRFYSRWNNDAPAIKEGYVTAEQAGKRLCWWVMNNRLELASPVINWIE